MLLGGLDQAASSEVSILWLVGHTSALISVVSHMNKGSEGPCAGAPGAVFCAGVIPDRF